jgi:hypothetical protein
MNADGSNQQQVLNDPGDERYPGFSPDARKIVFISDRDGDYEIYLMDASGANVVQLTNNAVLDAAPAWSPDGSRIAFRSERDGQSEIYVMNADGSNQQRLTNNPAREEGPAWSPDGTMMAFTSERDGNQEIYVMRSDGSAPVNLTNAPTSQELSPDWGSFGASAPLAGQSPSTGQPARDRTAPRLRVRSRSRQRAVKRRAVVLSVSCDERCSVSAKASVRISGKRKRLGLTGVQRTIRANDKVNLRLKLAAPKRRTVRRALRRNRAVITSLRVSARDGEGNASSVRRRVQIVK